MIVCGPEERVPWTPPPREKDEEWKWMTWRKCPGSAPESMEINDSDERILSVSLLRKFVFSISVDFFIIFNINMNRKEDAPDLRIGNIN